MTDIYYDLSWLSIILSPKSLVDNLNSAFIDMSTTIPKNIVTIDYKCDKLGMYFDHIPKQNDVNINSKYYKAVTNIVKACVREDLSKHIFEKPLNIVFTNLENIPIICFHNTSTNETCSKFVNIDQLREIHYDQSIWLIKLLF